MTAGARTSRFVATVAILAGMASAAFAQKAPAKLLFRVRNQDRGMQNAALANDKTILDYSEVTLPGALVKPPQKLAPVTKASAKFDTPAAAAAADFVAEKSDDAEWIIAIFAPADRADAKSMLADKNLRTRNRGIFAHKAARYVRGQAIYKNYVLLFFTDGKPDNSPQVLTLVKTPDGFRRTNALANDETYDIVWSALRLGEVKPVK